MNIKYEIALAITKIWVRLKHISRRKTNHKILETNIKYGGVVLLVLILSIPCFSQMRPLPAKCYSISGSDTVDGIPRTIISMADEPDIHNRFEQASKDTADKMARDAETKARLDKIVHDMDLLDKLSMEKDNVSLYKMENLSLQLKDEKELRRLEKKIAGFTGLILFATGNETLKNVGLVGLFCYSIW